MDPFKPLVAFAYCASVCVCEMRKQKWKIIPNSIANEIEGERPHKYTHIHTVAHTKSIQSILPPKNAPKTESAPQKGHNRRFTQFGRFKSKIRSRQSEKQKIQHNWISNTKYSRQKKKEVHKLTQLQPRRSILSKGRKYINGNVALNVQLCHK